MRADSKAIDFVPLFVQAEDRLLIDVVRRDYSQRVEPRNIEAFRNQLERFTRQARQVGQVTRVDPNPDCAITLIIQRQRDCTEIQQARPAIIISIDENKSDSGNLL